MGEEMEGCGEGERKSEWGYVCVIRLYRGEGCDGCGVGSVWKKWKGKRRIYVKDKVNGYKKEGLVVVRCEEGLKERREGGIEGEGVFGEMKGDMDYKGLRDFGMEKV